MPKPILYCCTVGRLAGDAWMTVPKLIDLCKTHDVRLIHGTYAGPVYTWAKANILGADWDVYRVIPDPDDANHPFCPGFGTIAMNPALEFVRRNNPDAIGWEDIDIAYDEKLEVTLRVDDIPKFKHITIHPYTRHNWKNCGNVVQLVNYGDHIVYSVGLYDEPRYDRRIMLTGFDDICSSILSCKFFVGVLSSWTNFAALFQLRQIIVSFTEDVPIVNPNASVLVNPELDILQSKIEEYIGQ